MILAIDVDASDAVNMVDGIQNRVDSADPLLQILVDEVHQYEADLFATGGKGQWAGADLIDTGALMADLTGNENIFGEDAMVAAEVAYAKFLKAGARGAPPRDPAPQPPAALVDRWGNLLLDHVIGHGL